MRLLFPLLLLATTGAAQAADLSDPLPRFERQGDGFVCHGEADAGAVQSCLKIGLVSVGLARSKLERQFGQPENRVVQDGRDLFVYSLIKNASGFAQTVLQVTYAPDQTVDSVQVSGLPDSAVWNFCGLKLGDDEAAIRARLGEPMDIASQDGETILHYSPWFSIALRQDRISSLRVMAAAASQVEIRTTATLPGFTARIGQ